jgi:DNA-binding IclR family transcriptional regulator
LAKPARAAKPAKAPGRVAGEERSLQAVEPSIEAQRSIQSVEIGFRLIRSLEEAAGPLSLKDLSARAGMPASKAYLYLVSFRRVGLVSQLKGSGHYALGPYALQLGLASLRKLDVVQFAHPILQELSEQTGEAAYLTLWCNRGPYIALRVDGARPLPMSVQIGYVLSLVSSATGRIFLSYLPRKTTDTVLEIERREAKSHGTSPDEFPLEKIIAETLSRGIARTDSLLNMGFTALSAPVFSHDGGLAAALTIIGPSSLIDASFTGPGARYLRSAAEQLSVRLGLESSVAAKTP